MPSADSLPETRSEAAKPYPDPPVRATSNLGGRLRRQTKALTHRHVKHKMMETRILGGASAEPPADRAPLVLSAWPGGLPCAAPPSLERRGSAAQERGDPSRPFGYDRV